MNKNFISSIVIFFFSFIVISCIISTIFVTRSVSHRVNSVNELISRGKQLREALTETVKDLQIRVERLEQLSANNFKSQ